VSEARPAPLEAAQDALQPGDDVPPEAAPSTEPPVAARHGVAPLTEQERARFWGTPEDRPTELRLGTTPSLVGKHYLAGNEKTLHAFRPTVEGIGGGYIGVGSDQAYFMIGWARPSFAWLVDYDADVVEIHAVYRAFFAVAETPEAFVELWRKDGRHVAARHIVDEHRDDRTLALRRLYLHHRGWIERRLLGQIKRLRRAGLSSWLTDPNEYDFVRSLVLADRVRPMVADLLHEGALRNVAIAAKELGVPIRVLYLSNAEEYWKQYTPEFRDNVLGLPFDERSVLLRTLLIWDVNQDYRYNIQPLDTYRAWLSEPWVRNVYDIVHARGKASPDEINVFESRDRPRDAPRARKLAAARGEDEAAQGPSGARP
jgi:hypothetical protein